MRHFLAGLPCTGLPIAQPQPTGLRLPAQHGSDDWGPTDDGILRATTLTGMITSANAVALAVMLVAAAAPCGAAVTHEVLWQFERSPGVKLTGQALEDVSRLHAGTTAGTARTTSLARESPDRGARRQCGT